MHATKLIIYVSSFCYFFTLSYNLNHHYTFCEMYDNFYLNRKLIIQAYRSFFFSIDIIFYFYFKEKRCIILFEIFCDVVFSQ